MTDILVFIAQLSLKGIGWVLLFLIVCQVWWTFHTGRLAASLQDSQLRFEHRAARRRLFQLFVAEVIVAEILSRWTGLGESAESAFPQSLLHVHLALDACFALVVLSIVLRFNGTRSPQMHARWVYRGFLPLSVAVIGTGGALLYLLM